MPETTLALDFSGDLGGGEGADLVREKIRIRLMNSEQFSVVERPESADAVLTGIAGVERTYEESVNGDQYGNLHGNGGTSFSGLGVLRLVDVRTDETVWVFEYKPGYMFLGGSVSSRVADKTIEKLLKDARQSDTKK